MSRFWGVEDEVADFFQLVIRTGSERMNVSVAGTWRHCRWARPRLNDGGREHRTAVRVRASKWRRTIWKCWQQRALYNEGTYMRSLQKRNPELYQLALDTTLPRHASN